MSLEIIAFQKVFWNQATFWVAYAFMPEHEKCPDSSVAEIIGVLKDFNVERADDLINAQLLFTKSHYFKGVFCRWTWIFHHYS